MKYRPRWQRGSTRSSARHRKRNDAALAFYRSQRLKLKVQSEESSESAMLLLYQFLLRRHYPLVRFLNPAFCDFPASHQLRNNTNRLFSDVRIVTHVVAKAENVQAGIDAKVNRILQAVVRGDRFHFHVV